MRKLLSPLAFVVTLLLAAIPAQAIEVAHVHGNTNTPVTPVRSLLPTCTPQSAIHRMISYIRSQQMPDGSFQGIGSSTTADAVYALVTSGVNPSKVIKNGNSAIDWIYSQTSGLSSTGIAAKFLLALALAHRSTTAPNGFDFLTRVADAYDPATGLYDQNPTSNAYAVIALRAAGYRIPRHALNVWAGFQQTDGGWSAFLPQVNSDTNTTALAMIGLVLNLRFADIHGAVGYLHTQQGSDGGFPAYSTYNDGTSDADSTALSILGLLAAGQNLANWEKNGVDPVKRLLRFQNPNGSFRYSDVYPGDTDFATYQAGLVAGLTRCHDAHALSSFGRL